MATHSSVLPWRIPGTGEPGGLPMGSHKVRHNWSDLAAAVAAVAQMVKNLPAMQETQVRSLGQEDLLEKKMATPSSILAWGSSMDRWAWWASLWLQIVRHDWATNSFTFFFFFSWSLVYCSDVQPRSLASSLPQNFCAGTPHRTLPSASTQGSITNLKAVALKLEP